MVGTDDAPKKMLPNFLANMISLAVNALVGLLMVPYYIDTLGVAAYGIIPLATSMSSYVALISDSLSTAIGRYVAVSAQSGDEGGYSRTYNTALFGLLRVILVILPIALLVGMLSPVLFNTGGQNWADVQILFVGIMISVLVTAWSNCFTSVLFGCHRLDLYNAVKMVNVLLQVGLVLAMFFVSGPALSMVGISYACASLAALLASYIMVRRIQPQLKIRRKEYDNPHFKDICSLGAWSLINSIGSLLFLQTSLIVCNLMLGADKAGAFAIIVNIITAVSAVCNTISMIFTPITYHLFAKNEIGKMGDVCRTAVKICGIVMAFPMAFICIFAPELLQAWLGTGNYSYLTSTILIMFATLVAIEAISPVYPVFMANLKVRIPGLVTFGLGLLNVACAIVAAHLGYGINGIAFSWAVTMTVKNLVFNPLYFARIMKESPLKMYSKLLPGMAVFILLAVVGIWLNVTLPATWSALLPAFFLGLLVYLCVSLYFLLNKNEKKMVMYAMPDSLRKYIPDWFAGK